MLGRVGGRQLKRSDQDRIVGIGNEGAALDRIGELGDAVDHAQHRADERSIGPTPIRPAIRENILRRMAEHFEPGEIKETAASLHRVDEAENRIETRPVVGSQLPGDDLSRQGFQRFAGFRDKIAEQIVHCTFPNTLFGKGHAGTWLRTRLCLPAQQAILVPSDAPR